MTNIEWGPWAEHDGKGCPVPAGTHVLTEIWCPGGVITKKAVASGDDDSSWSWDAGWWPIIRYRIGKPRSKQWTCCAR